jgi:hypothetical protein
VDEKEVVLAGCQNGLFLQKKIAQELKNFPAGSFHL